MVSRPPTISIKNLATVVEQAVKIASQSHNVNFSPEFRIGPGTIMGRQLLQAEIELKRAEKIASDITQQVTSGAERVALGATPLEPAVLAAKGVIICGFIAGPVWEI